MTDRMFETICLSIFTNLKVLSPFDTGNLRYHAIKYEFIDAKTCKFYVDEDIAPYMPYTNEPWRAERWKGAKNPNEGWWDNASQSMANAIQTIVGYKIKEVKKIND